MRNERLAGEIAVYEQELEARPSQDSSRIPSETIRGVLRRAREALVSGDLDLGWRCVHAARRLDLANLDDAGLLAAVDFMRAEANQKLRDWRKEAVLELLKASAAPTLGRIVKAAEIRDGHYDNEEYKDRLRRGHTLRLALALCTILVILLAWSSFGYLRPIISHSVADEGIFKVLVGLVLVGSLGATVSALTATASTPRGPTRIPEMVSSAYVTIARLMMGPASAVIVFFVVQSTFYDGVFNLARPNGYGLLVIAFVAGFTERLVLRVVELVAGASP